MYINQIQLKMNRFKSEKLCFGNYNNWLFGSIRKIQCEKDILTANSWASEFYHWPPTASNSNELDKQGEPTMQSTVKVLRVSWSSSLAQRRFKSDRSYPTCYLVFIPYSLYRNQVGSFCNVLLVTEMQRQDDNTVFTTKQDLRFNSYPSSLTPDSQGHLT